MMLEITQDSAHAAPLTTAETAARAAGAAKETAQNQVLAAPEEPLTPENAAENALRLAGLRLTPENRALVAALLLRGLAADKDTLVQMNRAMKLTENDMAKALFLVKNELRPTAANVETLNALAKGEAKLGTQLQALLAAAEGLPEGEAKQSVLRLLTGNAPVPSERAMDALFRPAEGTQTTPRTQAQTQPPTLATPSTPIQPGATGQPVPPGANTAPVQTPEAGQAAVQQTQADAIKTALPQAREGLAQAFTQALASGEPLDLPRAEALIRQAIGQGLLPENARDGAFTRAAVRFILAETAEAMPAREREALQKLAETPVSRKLIFPHRDGAREDIDRFLTDLRVTLAEAKTALSSRGAANDAFTRAADAAENGVRLLQDMRNAVVVQLPILLNQRETTAELYVFRDKRKKNVKGGSATALLALDEANLGRVEAYIRREGQAVSCQFRLGEKRTETLIRAELHRLSAQLAAVGFRLEGVTYRAIDEPFGILDAEPGAEGRDEGEIPPVPYKGLDEKA